MSIRVKGMSMEIGLVDIVAIDLWKTILTLDGNIAPSCLKISGLEATLKCGCAFNANADKTKTPREINLFIYDPPQDEVLLQI